MDTINLQPRFFINQEDKPITFYSIELTGTPKGYTLMENELLSTVKTMKDF